MQTQSEEKLHWCIYIDESGVDPGSPQFIYVAVCVPFASQRQFLADYAVTTAPLMHIKSWNEIKYGHLLNQEDHNFLQTNTNHVCDGLMSCFGKIEGAGIVRVKAIKKKIRLEGADLRAALFRKTLECCKELMPRDSSAIILHDELDSRAIQRHLLIRFNDFNKRCDGHSNFQNCVFVHSNENPFIQFADFIAAVCHRHYFYGEGQHKDKSKCAALAHRLFEKINDKFPRIVELSDITDDKDNAKKTQAIQLAEKHKIDLADAFNIVNGKITLEKFLKRKQDRERRRAAGRLKDVHDISIQAALQVIDDKITLDEALKRQQSN